LTEQQTNTKIVFNQQAEQQRSHAPQGCSPLAQTAGSNSLNGTLNKLKNLIAKNSDKQLSPTPNFAVKAPFQAESANPSIQKEASRLQSIISNLNSFFQKNGLQSASGSQQPLATPVNFNTISSKVTQNDQKSNMGQSQYYQMTNDKSKHSHRKDTDNGHDSCQQPNQASNMTRMDSCSDSNVTQLIDNAK